MHFGALVKRLSEKRGIGTAELAEKIDRTKQGIYDIYKRKHINTELLEKICTALDTTIDAFLKESLYINSENELKDESTSSSPQFTGMLVKQISYLEELNDAHKEIKKLSIRLSKYESLNENEISDGGFEKKKRLNNS